MNADSHRAVVTYIAVTLMHRYRIVASTAAIVVIITAIWAFMQPNVYRGSIGFLPIEDSESVPADLSQVAAMVGLAAPGGTGATAKIQAILGSRRMRLALMDEFDLRTYYGQTTWVQCEPFFKRDFLITIDGETGRITCEYLHPDAKKAVAIVARAGELLRLWYNDFAQTGVRQEREYYEEMLARAQKEYDVAAKAMLEFQTAHKVVQIEGQVQASIEAAATLQGELIAQQAELRGLLTWQFSEHNPEIELLQAKVKALEESLRGVMKNGTDSGQDGVLLAISNLPALAQQYLAVFKEVKKQEALIMALERSVETAKLREAKVSAAVLVIDPPQLPDYKAGPARLIILIVAVIAGTMLGVMVALAYDPVREMVVVVWAQRPRKVAP